MATNVTIGFMNFQLKPTKDGRVMVILTEKNGPGLVYDKLGDDGKFNSEDEAIKAIKERFAGPQPVDKEVRLKMKREL